MNFLHYYKNHPILKLCIYISQSLGEIFFMIDYLVILYLKERSSTSKAREALGGITPGKP